MHTPSIRLATLADAEALSALHVRAWRSAYRGLLPDDLLDGISLEEWTRRRRKSLEQPASPLTRTWIREGARGPIGFSIAGPCRDADLPLSEVGEIYAIYLEPEAVGLGHGHALMEHTLEVLRNQGFCEVALWVLEGNARARRFYELGGFRVDAAAPPRTLTIQGRVLDAPELRLRRPLP